MTHRERILAAIRGEVPDRLPWVPRLEFWHRARLRQGTLPPELRSLTLTEIADRLGVGCYSSVPDFTDATDDDRHDRPHARPFSSPGLALPRDPGRCGPPRHPAWPGNRGGISHARWVDSHRARSSRRRCWTAGASVPWTTEHAIREPRDFEVVGHIFSHLQNRAALRRLPRPPRRRWANKAWPSAIVQGTACPIQLHHEGTDAARTVLLCPP